MLNVVLIFVPSLSSAAQSGQPNDLARLFRDHGFKLDWVNREAMKVEPYRMGTEWKTHSTLIARRP